MHQDPTRNVMGDNYDFDCEALGSTVRSLQTDVIDSKEANNIAEKETKDQIKKLNEKIEE
jgi:hypothetical protein